MKPDLESRVFRKRNGALYPSDIHADEMFETIKDGKEVLLRVFRVRNIEQHKMMFAILNTVVQNSEIYPHVEALRQLVKLAVGHYWVVRDMNGEFQKIPKSQSFSAMPQDEFDRFFPRAVYALSRMSGIPESDLLRESKIEQKTGKGPKWGMIDDGKRS